MPTLINEALTDDPVGTVRTFDAIVQSVAVTAVAVLGTALVITSARLGKKAPPEWCW